MSDYYESVFDELPCGYSNSVAEIWYDWQLYEPAAAAGDVDILVPGLLNGTPSDKLFLNVLNVDCQEPGGHQADGKAIVKERMI